MPGFIPRFSCRERPTYAYERKGPSGKQAVNVPVDAGIRRVIHNSGKQSQMEQMLRLAEKTGANLVEVSWTSNPRDSHHKWEGKIYQIKGSGPYPNFYRACKVGDKVDGIGGYSCGHKATIYHEGGPRRSPIRLRGRATRPRRPAGSPADRRG